MDGGAVRGSLLDIPAVRDFLSQRIMLSVATGEKRLALTFDDGPHPRHTPRLLELLASKEIPATFFVVGRWVRKFGDVVAQTASAGHEIGNHSDLHVPMSLLPAPLIRRELRTTEDLVRRATGHRPSFFRPPMGWFNATVLEVARGMGYRPVIGSIHPRDSRTPGLKYILDHVRPRIEPGAIIILHDGGWRVGVDRSQTIEAVDRLTDELLENGYGFHTLSALTGSSGKPGPGRF